MSKIMRQLVAEAKAAREAAAKPVHTWEVSADYGDGDDLAYVGQPKSPEYWDRHCARCGVDRADLTGRCYCGRWPRTTS